MPSPFPGMDPYLERPSLWPDVHHGLISQIQALLNPLLRPKYVAGVELRVYISDDDDPGRKVMIPDVRVDESGRPKIDRHRNGSRSSAIISEPTFITLLNEDIEEAYLAIREVKSETLVAVIEVLSPTNKIAGSEGRKSFMRKRREVITTQAHWIEVDLLRAGRATTVNIDPAKCDYRIVVCKAGNYFNARFWPVKIRQQLPVISIPLRGKDPDVPLDLETVLQSAYDRAGWDLKIDYTKPPDPPLKTDDARWVAKLLRSKGLR